MSETHFSPSNLCFGCLPPAHAADGLQLPAGAEAQHLSVGPEGPHGPGAGPLGVEPAVSLPAGHLCAALLTAGVTCAAQMCRDAPWWGLSHPAEGLEPCSAPAAGGSQDDGGAVEDVAEIP